MSIHVCEIQHGILYGIHYSLGYLMYLSSIINYSKSYTTPNYNKIGRDYSYKINVYLFREPQRSICNKSETKVPIKTIDGIYHMKRHEFYKIS